MNTQLSILSQTKLDRLFLAMVAFNQGDAKRIQHFVKVHSFSRILGLQEGLDETALFTLEAAAYVHDIGIRPAEQKYDSCNGKLQEQEGPEPAKNLLAGLDFPEEITARVAHLVGHHHTYTNIDGLDYQILVEADFLVNAYEDQLSEKSIQTCIDRVFRTKSGISMCKEMFGLPK